LSSDDNTILHFSRNRKVTVIIRIESATGQGLVLQQNYIKEVFFGSLALEEGLQTRHCKEAGAQTGRE